MPTACMTPGVSARLSHGCVERSGSAEGTERLELAVVPPAAPDRPEVIPSSPQPIEPATDPQPVIVPVEPPVVVPEPPPVPTPAEPPTRVPPPPPPAPPGGSAAR